MRIERFDAAAPSRDRCQTFACGEASLDRWLVNRAAESMTTRFAVTYLLLDGEVIAGYFCLSSGEVRRAEDPESVTKRAPGPIPVIRMGRFAIDQAFQGRGLGADMLREAIERAFTASRVVGARGLLVDAVNDDARRFYERFGFRPSPIHPLQLVKDLRVVAESMQAD